MNKCEDAEAGCVKVDIVTDKGVDVCEQVFMREKKLHLSTRIILGNTEKMRP